MSLTRKKIIPEIPKISSPSHPWVYKNKMPLKPQTASAVVERIKYSTLISVLSTAIGKTKIKGEKK